MRHLALKHTTTSRISLQRYSKDFEYANFLIKKYKKNEKFK